MDHPQAGVELAFTVFRSLLHLSSHWKDRSTWINSDEVINVARLPESHKCISYDHEGNQPATKIWRSTAPILDETVISMDAKGKPVEPGRASFFLISQYGPGHKFLRDPSSRKSIVKFVLTADLVVSKNQIFSLIHRHSQIHVIVEACGIHCRPGQSRQHDATPHQQTTGDREARQKSRMRPLA